MGKRKIVAGATPSQVIDCIVSIVIDVTLICYYFCLQKEAQRAAKAQKQTDAAVKHKSSTEGTLHVTNVIA